jgi:hypothetical protein
MAQNGMDAFMGSLATFQGLQDNSRKWELQGAANRREDDANRRAAANEPRLDQATRIANEQNIRAAAEEKRNALAFPVDQAAKKALTAQTELATETGLAEFAKLKDGDKSKIVWGQAVDFKYFNPVDMAMTPQFEEDLLSENPQIQQRALSWLAQSGNSLLTPNSDAFVSGVTIVNGQIRLTTTNKKDGSKSSLTEDTSNDPNAKVLSLTIDQATDLLNTHMVGTVNRQANPQYDGTRRSIAEQTLEVIAATQLQLSQADPKAGRSFAGMLVDTTPEEKTEIANQALEAQGLPPLQGPEQPQPQLGEAIAPEPFVSNADTQQGRDNEVNEEINRIESDLSGIRDYILTGKTQSNVFRAEDGLVVGAGPDTPVKDPIFEKTNFSKSFRTLHRNANKNSVTTPEVFEEATELVGWYAKNEVELSKRIQSNPAVMDEIEKIGATEFARKYQSLDLSTPEGSTVLDIDSAVNQATGGTADGARDAAANGTLPKPDQTQLANIRSMVGMAGVDPSSDEPIKQQVARLLQDPQKRALIATAVAYADTPENGRKILDEYINLFSTGDMNESLTDQIDQKQAGQTIQDNRNQTLLNLAKHYETVAENARAEARTASAAKLKGTELVSNFHKSMLDEGGNFQITDNTTVQLNALGMATSVGGEVGAVATEYFVPSVIDYLKVKNINGGFSESWGEFFNFWRNDPKLRGGVGKSSQDVRVLLTKDGGLKALVIQDSSGANKELKGEEIMRVLDSETVRLLIKQAKTNEAELNE